MILLIVFRCLCAGGLLILEPQPWKSYHTAVHKQDMSSVAYRKYEALKLRPDKFQEYLTERVGFEFVRQLHAVDEENSKGFDRPILVLRKPAD